MPLDANWLADRIVILIPLWLSLSVHEWAHAWTAYRLGDDTAARLGRMTLNPLAHIDPIGTVLLPLLGIPFGWAKPVPIQPHRFHQGVSMRTGMMFTAVAGPISNLCLAAIFVVLVAIVARFRPDLLGHGQPTAQLLVMMIYLNLALAMFNALPIPPLDGSRVADALMPKPLRPGWEAFCQLGPFALMAVILLPQIAGIRLFYWPMHAASLMIHHLILLMGG
jgi:Zn-dependent protease